MTLTKRMGKGSRVLIVATVFTLLAPPVDYSALDRIEKRIYFSEAKDLVDEIYWH